MVSSQCLGGFLSNWLSSVAPNVITCNAAIASFEEAGPGHFWGEYLPREIHGSCMLKNTYVTINWYNLYTYIYIYKYLFIFIDIVIYIFISIYLYSNVLCCFTYTYAFVFQYTHYTVHVYIYIYANVLKMYSCVRGALQMCFPEWHRPWDSLQQPPKLFEGYTDMHFGKPVATSPHKVV